ncbi:MAG: chorismate mutase [Streptococcus sp.]|nr:chorismate mutase [Streptococcus sp.]
MDLTEIRQEIDQVDNELVALLEKRMKLVAQVLHYKQSTGKTVLDKGREQVILEKVANQVDDKIYEESIVQTFSDILKNSRQYQEKRLS